MNGIHATPFASADQEIIRYLLGEMTSAEQSAFEARYFRDDELFAQVTLMREELADRYVRRQLSEAEKERYETHLLTTPAHHEEIAFAESLRQVLSESAAPKPQRFFLTRPVMVPRWSLAAAAVLLVSLLGGLSWLWRGQQRLRAETMALRADQTQAQDRERDLQQQLAALQKTTPSPVPQITPSLQKGTGLDESYVALQLTAPTRSNAAGNVPSASLSVNAHRLKLRINLDFAPRANSLRATLRSADGKILVKSARLPFRCNGNCSAVFEATLSTLRPGSYELVLNAIDDEENKPDKVSYLFQLIAPKSTP